MGNKPYVRYHIHHLPKCGAKTRQHTSCLQPAMKNGRCRLHGGKSTGPRTKAGLARCGNWKHGRYSKTEKARRRLIQRVKQDSHQLLRHIECDSDTD